MGTVLIESEVLREKRKKAQRGAISYSLCLYLFYAKDIDAKCLIARKE
jgi:hypothetical protein